MIENLQNFDIRFAARLDVLKNEFARGERDIIEFKKSLVEIFNFGLPELRVEVRQRNVAVFILGGVLRIFGKEKESTEKLCHEIFGSINRFSLRSEWPKFDESFRTSVAWFCNADIRKRTAKANVRSHISPRLGHE